MLGDVFWKGADSDNLIRRLKGHKHLIQGNHDRPDEEIRLCWESISGYAEINDGGRLVVMSHYPILMYKNQRRGAIMLYGHVHGNNDWMLTEKWKKELWDMGVPCRVINVGCMMPYMGYTPRTLDELLEANPDPDVKEKDDEQENG